MPSPTTRRRVEDLTGFCRAGHHHLCHWDVGYITPSAVIVCVCDCHDKRVMVPKGPAASSPRIVPKK